MNPSKLLNLLLGVLLICVLAQLECGKKPAVPGKDVKVNGKKYEVIKTVIDTEYVKGDIQWKKGKTIYLEYTIHDTIPQKVDTGVILKDYYAKRIYTDTVSSKYGSIYIKDTVSENKIVGRNIDPVLMIPVVKETQIVKEKPKNQLFIGSSVDYIQTVKNPTVGLILKTKRDRLYGISMGVGPGGQALYRGSFYIKL